MFTPFCLEGLYTYCGRKGKVQYKDYPYLLYYPKLQQHHSDGRSNYYFSILPLQNYSIFGFIVKDFADQAEFI